MSETREVLKQDLLGRVEIARDASGLPVAIVRDTRPARWWLRWIARRLAAREARALATLDDLDAVPAARSWDGTVLMRGWLDGQPMQVARPRDPGYFRDALRLLGQLHRAGIVHNDTAKEPNWLVRPDGAPALVDFQLAGHFRGRGRLFRMLAREDLRHLLKHKRTYCPDSLTARQRRMLDTPSWLSRIWMATGKRVYLVITRRVLGWRDREGAGDRHIP